LENVGEIDYRRTKEQKEVEAANMPGWKII